MKVDKVMEEELRVPLLEPQEQEENCDPLPPTMPYFQIVPLWGNYIQSAIELKFNFLYN